ncbi:MAG: AAA family ATPase [Brevundimonas sp.]|uniref:AAA family ATPase n=1 Tax=Brevundimonas sp. TaxID=1871086 RepID=UPI00391B0934
MKYTKFRIQKFKGISDATVHLSPQGNNVFTLIGLNESGKTSILEAISAFKPDRDYDNLVGKIPSSEAHTTFIPKPFQSNFTDKTTITATIELSEADLDKLIRNVEQKHKVILEKKSIPNPIQISRVYKFEDSEFKGSNYLISMTPRAKAGGERKYRDMEFPHAIWHAVADGFTSELPNILYFPTFLFSLPSRIILNPSEPETNTNRIYRKILDDVAASLPNSLNIQKHVVERIIGKVSKTEKSSGVPTVVLGNNRQLQAAAALNDISVHISETVFDEWQKVLGSNVSGRELSLQPGIEIATDSSPQVFVQFMMKDGAHSYDISERSLGFRWFFSFLLFTLYRSIGATQGQTLFLLDEPASNLHARAQAQLLESFPKIASGGNALIYSTHSHYMVEPSWLEQTSIISNSAIERAEAANSGPLKKSNPTEISATRYRRFVGENPDKITYFLPVLDQLDYAPSRLELTHPSMLVEGKGDYAILEYVKKVVLEIGDEVRIVPTRGATGMDDLIGLFLGWGVRFCICLDADKEGKAAKARYIKEWGLDPQKVFTFYDIDNCLDGQSIEGLLDDGDIARMTSFYGNPEKLTKEMKRMYFSELLARKEKIEISHDLSDRVRLIVDRASAELGANPKDLAMD